MPLLKKTQKPPLKPKFWKKEKNYIQYLLKTFILADIFYSKGKPYFECITEEVFLD